MVKQQAARRFNKLFQINQNDLNIESLISYCGFSFCKILVILKSFKKNAGPSQDNALQNKS
jgi:hypothetical protein